MKSTHFASGWLLLPVVALGLAGASCDTQSGVEGHVHDAEDIASGVLSGDLLSMGSGSELDADLLDGQDSSSFAPAVHQHSPVLFVAPGWCNQEVAPEVDTTEGHFTVTSGGEIRVVTPGIYRFSARATGACSTMMNDPCSVTQVLLKNGVQVGGESMSWRPQPGESSVSFRFDATHTSTFARGDTFVLEYDCTIRSMMGNSCSACSGYPSLQIEFLGQG